MQVLKVSNRSRAADPTNESSCPSSAAAAEVVAVVVAV
jgi:hypothetical protein